MNPRSLSLIDNGKRSIAHVTSNLLHHCNLPYCRAFNMKSADRLMFSLVEDANGRIVSVSWEKVIEVAVESGRSQS